MAFFQRRAQNARLSSDIAAAFLTALAHHSKRLDVRFGNQLVQILDAGMIFGNNTDVAAAHLLEILGSGKFVLQVADRGTAMLFTGIGHQTHEDTSQCLGIIVRAVGHFFIVFHVIVA